MLEGAGLYLTLFYTCTHSLALSLPVALIKAKGQHHQCMSPVPEEIPFHDPQPTDTPGPVPALQAHGSFLWFQSARHDPPRGLCPSVPSMLFPQCPRACAATSSLGTLPASHAPLFLGLRCSDAVHVTRTRSRPPPLPCPSPGPRRPELPAGSSPHLCTCPAQAPAPAPAPAPAGDAAAPAQRLRAEWLRAT